MSAPRRLTWLVVLLLLAGCGEQTEPSDVAGTRVVEVVDGDTLDVRLPDGTTERVRIIGVNAPESGECLADDATRWLTERIGDRAVTLIEDRSDRDRYGRLLRYVEAGGADVGQAMVADGLAIARRYRPDTSRSDQLEQAQRSAEREERGLWSDQACGPATRGADGLAISQIRFDAEGADGDNLNDEWVRLTNHGDDEVDLTGWRLKDESASNRFDFPDGFALAPGTSVTVRSGCGTDSATELHWCASGSAIWNNDGDTAFLLDPSGNVVEQRRG